MTTTEKFYNAITAIQEICGLDLNTNWNTYHMIIIAYLEAEGCEPLTSLTEEESDKYLNLPIPTDADVIDFLKTHCAIFKAVAA